MNNRPKQAPELDDIPEILAVIPTVDVVVFPHMVVPLLVLDEKIIKGINEAMAGNKKILLLATKQQPNSYQGPIGVQDLYKVGTVAHIMRAMNLPDGGIKVLTQGLVRARAEDIISNKDVLNMKTEILPFISNENSQEEIAKKVKEIIALTEKISVPGKVFGSDFQVILSQISDPERIADFLLSHLTLSVEQAQMLLEKNSIHALLDGIYEHLYNEIEVSKVQEKIRVNARESINKSQREYYLREQLKAIQKELGEEQDSDIEELKNKIDALPLTDEAKTEASRQMRRLEKTSPDSLEATVIRNHLEWLLGLPWGVTTKDTNELARAKEVLNKEHFGLDQVKDRILDYLSIRAFKEDCHTPIICFVGPAGVGKTSLGKSIANCLSRNFFRIALGGVHDESEIRGHRRTYVGALPGRFIQAMRKSGSMNPVVVIDEIDKIGNTGRGDPASALLEVLDPEQNSNFYDNYLGVHFDLSKVMFIVTANDISQIPGPLRDRMEVISIAGYTEEEKLEIAERYLVPKAIKNSGLEGKGLHIGRPILKEVIHGYTRESGVRDLARTLQKLCSKYARELVESSKTIEFTTKNLPDYLGPRRRLETDFTNAHKIGVTNGLCWSPYGGEVLQVEAVLMPGTGRIILTGNLSEVMKESAQAAVSYARAHAAAFHIDQKLFTTNDIHIHLPGGAVHKDGPSAGVTLLSSVLSALTNRHINGTFAMTGEINLQGSVLAIGGLKEKILAAKQQGLSNVIMPKQNQKDLVGMEDILHGINLLFVDNVEEVLKYVLMPETKPQLHEKTI